MTSNTTIMVAATEDNDAARIAVAELAELPTWFGSKHKQKKSSNSNRTSSMKPSADLV